MINGQAFALDDPVRRWRDGLAMSRDNAVRTSRGGGFPRAALISRDTFWAPRMAKSRPRRPERACEAAEARRVKRVKAT